jgi:hypothetical protein
MAKKTLKWNGKAVSDRMKAAQIEGVNRTMASCVNTSKSSHEWKNRTSVLEGGIDIVDYAVEEGSGVKGVWGVRDVRYALIHELGGWIRAKAAKALAIPMIDGSLRFVKAVFIPARPYLRPSADANYPSLAQRIRKAYQRGGRGE